MKIARFAHAVNVRKSDAGLEVLVTGGITQSAGSQRFETTAAAEVFDTWANRSSACGPMALPRFLHTIGPFGWRSSVLGGMGRLDKKGETGANLLMEEFDEDDRSFRTVHEMEYGLAKVLLSPMSTGGTGIAMGAVGVDPAKAREAGLVEPEIPSAFPWDMLKRGRGQKPGIRTTEQSVR